jgi:TPR repeat protein
MNHAGKAATFLAALMAVLLLSSCIDLAFEGWDLTKEAFRRAAPMGFWREKAEAGDPEAEYYYGRSFCCGNRPLYDNHKALFWFCKAAPFRQRDALFQIGSLYENANLYEGFLLPRDMSLAYVYYAKAEEAGHEEAGNRRSKLAHKLSKEEMARAQQLSDKFPNIPCGIPSVTGEPNTEPRL